MNCKIVHNNDINSTTTEYWHVYNRVMNTWEITMVYGVRAGNTVSKKFIHRNIVVRKDVSTATMDVIVFL